MADEAAARSGWLKTFIGAVAGVMSGAVMMYLSPLVDKVFKPAKPLANFAVEHQGLTVTFHNSSSGGDGWWDFGDGSALEPAAAKQPSVAHTYAQPGTYTVKLSLRNLLNEESDRTVTLNLDSDKGGAPTITSLDAVPVGGHGCCVPATFRLTSRTKNADILVWDCGDEKPLQIVSDLNADSDQDRFVTFTKPGGYVIKLAAINGKQAQVTDTIIYVDWPPQGALTAVLTVSEQAMREEKTERPIIVTETFTATSGTIQPVNRQVLARKGFEITSASVDILSGQGVKDLRVQVAADRRSAQLIGQLERQSAGILQMSRTQPSLTARVMLTEEKRTPVDHKPIPMSTTLNVPGTALVTLPPCPCDWNAVQRQMRLELREGERVLWPESPLPHNAILSIQDRKWLLNATPVGEQLRIDVSEIKPGAVSAN